ncbi:RNA polymerase sigma factor [Chondrinema litorale]|uniref:RNA polymerase sigma factor n=1 Tax=Chondrinema litorale TaxID=2994555 RepID=UPI00254278D3|nr:sigma-70 family RNA polymerase sigma factor [Chondrinema litorale]UZR98045.1 sigma-70 family RNA polymerase sigma factor [Chondrinema litorale]
MITKSFLKNDAALWAQFREDDRLALKELYFLYVDALFCFGKSFTKDHTLIEDCLQDLFLELWDKRKQLDLVESVKAYLFTALKRKIVRRLQERKRKNGLHTEMGFQFQAILSLEEVIIEAENVQTQLRRAYNAINKLSKREKEAFHLRYTEGFDYNEISEIMEISNQASRNLVHLALRNIRKELFQFSSIISMMLFFF